LEKISKSTGRALLALSPEEIASEVASMGEPPFRARQLLKWLYRSGADRFDAMTDLPKGFRERLAGHFEWTAPSVERFESADGTVKYRFCLTDGASVEAVWMPEERRNTLCISSQVGCALKCAFCVTGAVGFKRNLRADEIVAQVRHVKLIEGKPVTNVVFMGMGEPLLNSEEVARSIAVLSSPEGLKIGRRRITVSTAGIVPAIRPFLERTGVKLAVSLTGASDGSRDHWMPINRKYDLAALVGELRKLRFRQGQRVTFEVVLMRGETDSDEEASRLAKLLKGIPAKVNLIPYNENPAFPLLRRPDPERVEAFRSVLLRGGIHATVRRNRGEDILAACGQLAGTDWAA
jgi:23S rRNA (adenine2503-C2)-methyltransferase